MSESDMHLLSGKNAEHWSAYMHTEMNAVAAVILFVIAICGGATPLWLVSRYQPISTGERSLAISLGNMLSSGGERNTLYSFAYP